jgi:hypothetical protein
MIFTKRIDEVLDYDFDFTNFLGTDEITTAAVRVTPAGLTLGQMLYNAYIVKQYVSGGTVDTDYTITAKITTSAGRTKEMDIVLRVIVEPS